MMLYSFSMNKPRILIGISLFVLLVAGCAYTITTQRSLAFAPISNTQSATSTTSQNTYTQADIAQHNSESNCWTSIEGGVYDLTTWISRHPGGPQAIIGLCGTDGTDAFNGKHGTSRRPRAALILLKIGILK